MISVVSLRFFINAALEVPAILFLGAIIISLFFRKTEASTKKTFFIFATDLLLLLVCNMGTWILDGLFVSPQNHPNLYKLDMAMSVFDFFFYSFASVLFLNYLLVLIGDTNRKKRIRRSGILLVYTLLVTALYASSIYTEWFYTYPEDGYTYYTPAYWVLVIFSIPAIWVSYAVVIKNRVALGKRKVLILLSYLVVPMLLSLIDQSWNLSVSYLTLAFIASLIYIGIDVEQDHELLRQQTKIARYEAERAEMGVNLVMSQIQPHFLFNTLSAISYLCRHDPKEAENAVNEFADYLSGNLHSINTLHPILFETELAHVENYLKIQKRRFQQRIHIEYEIDAVNFQIPPLTLQTIVENAVKHAVEKSPDMTTICICSEETKDAWLVRVVDDGPGFDPMQKPQSDRPHIGILSVKSRLANMVGGRLEIESEPGKGTVVTVVIPKEKEV